YSGGMRRRLDLALALVHRPKVLFLDEPTTGLDPASRLVIWDKVRELHAQGTTVFLTTQYLEEADQLADRVAILDAGRIVSEGTPAERKATVGQPRLDLRFENGAGIDISTLLGKYGTVTKSGDNAWSITVNDESTDLSGVMSALAGSGAVVQSLDLVRPTL